MNLSLILSTKGRVAELSAYLDSLLLAFKETPAGTTVELIISDQNEDDRLHDCLSRFTQAFPEHPGLSLQHVKTSNGLSQGRNVGLIFASGDLVAFPDDDCLYDSNVLREVLRVFAENPLVGFLGVGSKDALKDATTIPMPTEPCGINVRLMPLFSPTLFVRRSWLAKVGGFDESLGVGAPFYGAGEETDLVLRLLSAGALGIYLPQPIVFHPAKALNPLSRAQLRRQLSYGRGLGGILAKHKKAYGYFFWVQLLLNTVMRPLASYRSANQFLQAVAYSTGVVSGLMHHRKVPLAGPPPMRSAYPVNR